MFIMSLPLNIVKYIFISLMYNHYYESPIYLINKSKALRISAPSYPPQSLAYSCIY